MSLGHASRPALPGLRHALEDEDPLCALMSAHAIRVILDSPADDGPRNLAAQERAAAMRRSYATTVTSLLSPNEPAAVLELKWVIVNGGSVLACVDVYSGQAVWSRELASPMGSFVHDSMWVVLRDTENMVDFYAPVTGKRVGMVDLGDHLTSAEQTQHFDPRGRGWSSNWIRGAKWTFIEYQSRPMFLVRLHWGRRIVIDLESVDVLTELGPELSRVCEAAERATEVSDP